MKKKMTIVLGVFALIGIGLFYILSTDGVGRKLETYELKRQDVSQTLEEQGFISSKRVQAHLASRSTKVTQVYVQLGEDVEEGQKLLSYASELDAEIEKIERQMDAREATHAEMSGADQASINQAKIDIAASQRSLELAQKEEERKRSLHAEGAVSLRNLEQAVQEKKSAEDQLRIAQGNYEALLQGAPKRTQEKYEADMDILQISLSALQEQREDATIRANFAGVVTELPVFAGQEVYANQLLVELQDDKNKMVTVDFLADQVQMAQAGMKASVLDSRVGLHIEDLRVNRVYPKAFVSISELGVRENRRSLEIDLEGKTEQATLGLEVRVQIELDQKKDALMLPLAAVYTKESKSYVELVQGRKQVEKQVTLGQTYGELVEVLSGLSVSDRVILRYESAD